MLIRHLDKNSTKNIKITKRPQEELGNYAQRSISPFGFQDATVGGDIFNSAYPITPEIKTYKRAITDDMKGTDVVQVDTNRSNLSVAYTDKSGDVIVKQGGNKAWRTNNPGNLSFSSLEKAKESGAIGVWEDAEGHKFGIFPSEEAGKNALKEKLRERRFSYRQDGSKRSIADMISETYAPAADRNDPRGYAKFLNDRYGVDVYRKSVEDLDDEEMERLLEGIAAREGNKPGKLIAQNNPSNSSI